MTQSGAAVYTENVRLSDGLNKVGFARHIRYNFGVFVGVPCFVAVT